MNTMQRGIITLLKSAVTETSLELPAEFDLQAAYPLLKRHHMATLVYDGAVRCGIDSSLPVMQKLFQSYVKLMLVSERQMAAVKRVCSAFDAASIDYMPLKGCVMKEKYPKPELRVMGDADILIRLEQYETIVPLMEELGFSAKMESDHELVWVSNDLFLELHKRLMPSYNRDFHRYFGDSWSLAKVRDGSRYSMTVEDGWIYLFTHFAKHFRDGGIGCRHMVDLWVYLRSVQKMDEEYVHCELSKFGLLTFHQHIRELLLVWFEDGKETTMSDFLTDALFNSGSFGTQDYRLLSWAVRDKKYSALGKNSRLMYLWQTAFPSVLLLKDKYTILRRAPWLLPVVWLVRPFYKILFERKSLERQKSDLKTLDEERVDARRAVLHEIGLDYNF